MPEPLTVRCEPWRAKRMREVAWLDGSCLAAPRDLLLELGPFCEAIHMYGEDRTSGCAPPAPGIGASSRPTSRASSIVAAARATGASQARRSSRSRGCTGSSSAATTARDASACSTRCITSTTCCAGRRRRRRGATRPASGRGSARSARADARLPFLHCRRNAQEPPPGLLLAPGFPPTPGGIERTAGRLAQHLGDVDLRVVAACSEPRAAVVAALGADPSSALRITPNTPAGGRRATLALNRAAARAAFAFRPEVVVALHVRAMPAARLARLVAGARVVLTIHAKEMREVPRTARAAVCWADAVVTVSGYARRLALEAGAAPPKLRTIHPGVDLPADPGYPVDERPGPPTLVTVSRLDERYKGHDVLLRALPAVRQAVPDTRYVVVGDGRRRAALERLALEQGVAGAVHFAGTLDDGERDDLLRSAHVFAMLSREPDGGYVGEGFGMVYLEANAHRLPVVGGRTPGVVDAVADGESGVLVDPADPTGVAAAIIRLLTDDGAARDLGERGAARAERFAWPAVAAQYREVIDAVLEGPGLGCSAGPPLWIAELARGGSVDY